jgi:hypothetical protein
LELNCCTLEAVPVRVFDTAVVVVVVGAVVVVTGTVVVVNGAVGGKGGM